MTLAAGLPDDMVDPTVVMTRTAACGALAPAIEREVFQLARRVALQAELSAAMRVLHHGLSQLTDSPTALCMLFDLAPGSPWTVAGASAASALDDEIAQLAAQVFRTGRRAVFDRVLGEPVGASPARAVLVIRRPPAAPAYGGRERGILAAIASVVAGLIGHFAADHRDRYEQDLRDARSPFRPQALAERRTAQVAPGRLITAPRGWMRWAYPTLIGLLATVLLTAAVVEVPTYAAGVSIITVEGEQITSAIPGTVAELLVQPGTRVAAGAPLLRLRGVEEVREAAAAERDYRSALAAFLTLPSDVARLALSPLTTRRQRAKAAVEQGTLRATVAGVVGDVRVRAGQLVTPGVQVMKIATSARPSVIAILPGRDLPRLTTGMTLQIELPGYHKRRELAVIDAIATQVIGPDEARRSLGDPIGDALPIAGPVVIVHGQLATTTFEASGRDYAFHDGMLGKAEVRVDRESLLSALLPGKAD